MESFWFIVFITLCSSALLKGVISLIQSTRRGKLPPGPTSIPILGSFLWLPKTFGDLEPILKKLHSRYGPIITFSAGNRKDIYIATHSLAHKTLIQNGAIFAGRPQSPLISKLASSNQHNISVATYGPHWRLLRRNLTQEILNPSRVKTYSPARKWAMGTLIKNLKQQYSQSGEPVQVAEHFRRAVFELLIFMCFGQTVDEKMIKELTVVQRNSVNNFGRFHLLNFFPRLGRIVFRKRWRQLLEIRANHVNALLPLIESRREQAKKIVMNSKDGKEDNNFMVAYVDTLLNLKMHEKQGEKVIERNLNHLEIVSLCSEFLNAGTDTTCTLLQWIMANLVHNQEIQSKVFDEVKGVLGDEDGEIREEDLQKMPYLKAVVLEALRRHPPTHFLLPHAVTEDFNVDGYLIPKEATVNFMIAEMGRDPNVWEDPMEFKPERFLTSGDNGKVEVVYDITGSKEIKMMPLGSKEIKMMPFGAGRRICPGLGLGMLHLEYFTASLVREFKWTAGSGDEIDFAEKQDFTMVMKNPLKAHVTPRMSN